MKTVIAVVASLIIGAGAGIVAVQSLAKPVPAKLDMTSKTSGGDAKTSGDQAKLKSENQALREQIRALEEKLKGAQPGRPPVPPAAAPSPATGAPGDQLREQRRAEAEARRSMFSERFRDRREGSLQDEINATKDPEAQKRLTELQQYNDQMRELREKMRDAKTDDERNELRKQITEAGTAMRDLSAEQQNTMLRNLATQYGITDPAKQEEFMASVRGLQTSPLFRSEYFMGGMNRMPPRPPGRMPQPPPPAGAPPAPNPPQK